MSSCDVCGKEFTKKGEIERHKGKKNPCKAPKKLIDAALAAAGVALPAQHVEEPTTEFREVSKKFNSTLSKELRKEQGIYFTPKKARDLLFTKLHEFGVSPKVLLEPSFGSGEFLLDAKRMYPDAKILGVEMNTTLYNSMSPHTGFQLSCCDFLTWNGKADVIIGNPPYFVMPTDTMSPDEKKAFAAKHAAAMTGRPNIYVAFLYKCLTEHLTDNGYLAFIIPTSLYNSAYYQPMRDYICANTTIRYVETLNKPGFFETGQETMLLVLQKGKVNDEYIFRSNSGNLYISPDYKELYELTKNTKTLRDLGLAAKTGNVVWNQVKDKLANEGTLLIYSSNIAGSVLKLNNLLGKEKKQYVKGLAKPTLSGPVILVDRGYGNSYKFNAIKTDLKDFYAENHINVLYPKTPAAEGNLDTVLKSFKDPRTARFVQLFVGNGGLSATDIETIVPIYDVEEIPLEKKVVASLQMLILEANRILAALEDTQETDAIHAANAVLTMAQSLLNRLS